jgi:hypothetical protein
MGRGIVQWRREGDFGLVRQRLLRTQARRDRRRHGQGGQLLHTGVRGVNQPCEKAGFARSDVQEIALCSLHPPDSSLFGDGLTWEFSASGQSKMSTEQEDVQEISGLISHHSWIVKMGLWRLFHI